jgi:hypothetical protein
MRAAHDGETQQCAIMTQTGYFPSQAQISALIGKPSTRSTGGLFVGTLYRRVATQHSLPQVGQLIGARAKSARSNTLPAGHRS